MAPGVFCKCLKIRAKPLKPMRPNGGAFDGLRTPTLKVAGSNPVGRTKMNDPAQFEQVDATCGLGGVILCLEKLDMTGFAEYSSRTPKMRHKNQTASNRSKKRKNQAIRTRISHFVSAMKFSSIWHGVRFFNVR